jgi:4-diphosphocytidyl-2C-methyl-D-erythritol kinase
MVVKCYAKINIVLNVLGKYNDKLHRVDMVLLPLELHDSIQISRLKNSAKENYITFFDYSMGGIENNLVTKVITNFQKNCEHKQFYRIVINKCIPISAGLGGGSSNAAGTLLAINKLTKANLPMDELSKIGFELGSDIPFFLYNSPARVTGAGEVVEPIEIKNNYYVLVVKPKQGLSTKEVYEKSDQLELDTYDVDKVIEALKNGDDELLEQSIGNALEKPALELLPEIQNIKDELKSLGCKIVLMSGSGSSVFAMSTDKKLIKNAFHKFIDRSEFDVEMCKVHK